MKVVIFGVIGVLAFVVITGSIVWVAWDGLTSPPECISLAEEAGLPTEIVDYLKDPDHLTLNQKITVRSALEITNTDDLCSWIEEQPLSAVKELAEQLKALAQDVKENADEVATTVNEAADEAKETVEAIKDTDCLSAARDAGVPDNILELIQKPKDERSGIENSILRRGLDAVGLSDACEDIE